MSNPIEIFSSSKNFDFSEYEECVEIQPSDTKENPVTILSDSGTELTEAPVLALASSKRATTLGHSNFEEVPPKKKSCSPSPQPVHLRFFLATPANIQEHPELL
ncbi:hypothetical protein SLS60_001931 [Paraconiothyrium brasiliense]|uniref:Uncharacterized protein n=1 Tax=Paraconiothyrium brasiliense TaxID=300254 RepID=A0ABR3S0Q9_9PLEO